MHDNGLALFGTKAFLDTVMRKYGSLICVLLGTWGWILYIPPKAHNTQKCCLLMKCSSLLVLDNSSAASDDNFVKMTTFPFRWRPFVPCWVLTLASDWLITVKYRHVFNLIFDVISVRYLKRKEGQWWRHNGDHAAITAAVHLPCRCDGTEQHWVYTMI